MLAIEIKSERNNAYDLMARMYAKQNAKICSCLSSFESSFKWDLEKTKKANAFRIKDIYVTEYDYEKAEVRIYWRSTTKNDRRLVAIVREPVENK